MRGWLRNQRGAKYVVIGGFAIRAASYIRNTMDVDLIVAADAENEARVFAALATLPDHAARVRSYELIAAEYGMTGLAEAA